MQSQKVIEAKVSSSRGSSRESSALKRIAEPEMHTRMLILYGSPGTPDKMTL